MFSGEHGCFYSHNCMLVWQSCLLYSSFCLLNIHVGYSFKAHFLLSTIPGGVLKKTTPSFNKKLKMCEIMIDIVRWTIRRLSLCDDVCVSVIISQVVLWVRSSVRAHKGYLHPSLASYPGGTGSPGGRGQKTTF